MDILAQSALLVAILSFAVGVSVFARNIRNKLFLVFMIMTTLISAWALFFFLWSMWGHARFYRIHLALNIWLVPAGLMFIGFMVRIQRDWSYRALLAAALFLSSVLSVALALHLEREPVVRQLTYFWPGLIVLQILQLAWIDRREGRGPGTRLSAAEVAFDRRNLIYIGGLLVLSTSVMDHVPWMGTIVPSLGNLGLTAYLFFIGQAITQRKLLNLEAMVSRFFVLLAIALTLTGVYSLLFAYIEHSFPLFLLNSFIVSFLLLLLLEPIRRMTGYFAGRLLTPKHQRLEQAIRQAQLQVAGMAEPSALFDAILSTLREILQPESAAVYLLRPDGFAYRQARATGEVSSLPREILATHPLLAHCRWLDEKGKLPVVLDELVEDEIARSASRKQRETFTILLEGLAELRCNLLIPLLDRDRVLGFVLLRASTPPEPWGDNWGLLPLVYPYFELAAQAMRNLEVFVQQREKERLAALGEMAAGLAHEIRNPLGAIKGAAQFLAPASDDARPESRFLGIIVEEVDRLNRVVTQFLEYSKPPATDLKRTDLGVLVERTVEMLRPSLPGGIELRYEAPSRAVFAMAAPEQIRQVVINLIQNSIRALEANPAERRIVVRVEREASGAAIQVEDTGQGIKREHLDKLFIPFFTTSPSGTGLGLSISHKIVEAHRGRIEVASEEGRFTRFSVVIPAGEV